MDEMEGVIHKYIRFFFICRRVPFNVKYYEQVVLGGRTPNDS